MSKYVMKVVEFALSIICTVFCVINASAILTGTSENLLLTVISACICAFATGICLTVGIIL